MIFKKLTNPTNLNLNKISTLINKTLQFLNKQYQISLINLYLFYIQFRLLDFIFLFFLQF